MQLLPLFERMKVFINICLANLNSEKELNFHKKKNSYSQNHRDCLSTGESSNILPSDITSPFAGFLSESKLLLPK